MYDRSVVVRQMHNIINQYRGVTQFGTCEDQFVLDTHGRLRKFFFYVTYSTAQKEMKK